MLSAASLQQNFDISLKPNKCFGACEHIRRKVARPRQSKAERLVALKTEKPEAAHAVKREQIQRYDETTACVLYCNEDSMLHCKSNWEDQ